MLVLGTNNFLEFTPKCDIRTLHASIGFICKVSKCITQAMTGNLGRIAVLREMLRYRDGLNSDKVSRNILRYKYDNQNARDRPKQPYRDADESTYTLP